MKILILSLLIISVFASYPWTNCGKSTDYLTITDIEVSPDVLKVGENITISASGSLSEVIKGGKVTISVKLDGIKVKTETVDICTLDPTEYPCPIQSGPYQMKKSVEIPKIAPHGDYDAKILALDSDGGEILCAELKVKISK